LFGPVDIGGKIDQGLVDVGATHTAAAAQGGIEYLNGFHGRLLWVEKRDAQA
jgi:hypothetical protein